MVEYREITDIPPRAVDMLVTDFTSEGATVAKAKQQDGNWTIRAEFPYEINRLDKNKSVDHGLEPIEMLAEDIQILLLAVADGKLNFRIDVTKYQGDFHKTAQGINDTLDRVVLPLNEVFEVLTLIEQGNMTHTVNGDYRGKLGEFKDTVNGMVAKLSETIDEVISFANKLSNTSERVSAASQSLSQTASEQAASVEETSASIEEMAASIKQSTEKAQVTDDMADKARKDVSEGGVAFKQTVTAIRDIANKISIIDDIAYQTNMLALNAAVEATRSGEHGKGLTVVAADVRKLVESSQVAAQKIGQLVRDSVSTAETAEKLLDTIVPSIAMTSDLVQEIVAASQEQSAGVGQINTAMNQMNQITQQNASVSEELAYMAEEMAGQAELLQSLMSFFKIDRNQQKLAARMMASPANKREKTKPEPRTYKAPIGIEPAFDLSDFERFN